MSSPDDGSNPPVFAVSAGPLRIRHIPLANSVSPVAVDTVDTGEFDDLDKTNPYLVKFQNIDYNDNAQVRLFFSTEANLGVANVTITSSTTSWSDRATSLWNWVSGPRSNSLAGWPMMDLNRELIIRRP